MSNCVRSVRCNVMNISSVDGFCNIRGGFSNGCKDVYFVRAVGAGAADGIISGFRLIDSVEMIQFTAPISHGSSGGALLNMNGEVIGISTAGFDAGQNLNLAVSYEYINTFLMGLKN